MENKKKTPKIEKMTSTLEKITKQNTEISTEDIKTLNKMFKDANLTTLQGIQSTLQSYNQGKSADTYRRFLERLNAQHRQYVKKLNGNDKDISSDDLDKIKNFTNVLSQSILATDTSINKNMQNLTKKIEIIHDTLKMIKELEDAETWDDQNLLKLAKQLHNANKSTKLENAIQNFEKREEQMKNMIKNLKKATFANWQDTIKNARTLYDRCQNKKLLSEINACQERMDKKNNAAKKMIDILRRTGRARALDNIKNAEKLYQETQNNELKKAVDSCKKKLDESIRDALITLKLRIINLISQLETADALTLDQINSIAKNLKERIDDQMKNPNLDLISQDSLQTADIVLHTLERFSMNIKKYKIHSVWNSLDQQEIIKENSPHPIYKTLWEIFQALLDNTTRS